MNEQTAPGQPDSTRKPLPTRAYFKHWRTDNVRRRDLDSNGHVNNTPILEIAESGRGDTFMAVKQQLNLGGFFVLANLNATYFSDITYPAHPEVGTCISKLGTSSIQTTQGVFLGDTLVAVVVSTTVYMDSTTSRPTPLPEDLRAKLQEFVATS